MQPKRLLVLSSEPSFQRRIQVRLDEDEFLVAAASHVREARRMVEAEPLVAVVVDAREAAGRGAIRSVAEVRPSGPPGRHGKRAAPAIVAVVRDIQPDVVAEALSAGARDVLDISGVDALIAHRLRILTRERRGRPDARGATRELGEQPGVRWGKRKHDLLVGRSRQMTALVEQMDMIAKADIGVGIYGETGTGKELVARTIHAMSARAGRPFVVANCTALPENLFENELFGHERGAYTGADRRQTGLIAEAEGGTLLLDEIGDVSLPIQAKLLRLLQFREYKMVGGSKTLSADVRIMTTTHRDVAALVREGRFREDLYYRMNTLEVHLPPLRERLEDIPHLVDHFVALFNAEHERHFTGFDRDAIVRLQAHSWPGNVRELQSVVYRSLVMHADKRTLGGDDVELNLQVPLSDPIDLSRPFADLRQEQIERFERRYLEAVLTAARGNLSKASRIAQHERKSLWRLLKRYGINARAYRTGTRTTETLEAIAVSSPPAPIGSDR